MGAEAGPSELLYEPAHPFFIQSQEVRGSRACQESVLFVPHAAAYHSRKKWNKAQDYAALLATGETHCYICYRSRGNDECTTISIIAP